MTALADPRIADIVMGGKIRLTLFLPQYAETPTGGVNPLGAGLVAHEMVGALAEHLGLEMQTILQPTPTEAIRALNAGGCDVMVLGIEEPRRKLVDFTLPIFRFDYAYLVPDGSSIEEYAEVDRPGRRISVVQGHASWMTLKRVIGHAEIIGCDLPDDAFALLRAGEADVFALPREQLIDYAALLPGSRIFAQGFGVNDVGLAVAKGRLQHLEFFRDFAEEAKTSGLVGRILDSAELTSRGFNVAN